MRKAIVCGIIALLCCSCAAPVPVGNVTTASSAQAVSTNTADQPVGTSTSISGATETPTTTPTPEETTPAPTATDSPEPYTPLKEGDFVNLVQSKLSDRWSGSQAIVVVAEAEDSVNAQLWLMEKKDGKWAAVAGPWQADVGKNGVSKQMEGDGKSPSGVYGLGSAFGWAAEPKGVSYPYRKLDSADRWVDDVSSTYYNKWVRGLPDVCGTGEALSVTPEYKYAMVVHYNDDAVNVQGSAIFMHVWTAPGLGTGGCTAMSEEHMVSLLQWLDYGKRPVLVQGTQEQVVKLLNEDWGMQPLPEGWGYIDDFIPDIVLDIRYNTDHNFTGKRLAGYSASIAPMRMEAIEALKKAADGLREKELGIRIFDAYRPQKASDAMIAWAEDTNDTKTKKEYYPHIEKSVIPGLYVARQSNHRLGGTVDLTLLDWATGQDLDMGGTFDFFGDVSATWYDGLTKEQAANRKLLADVMGVQKYQPYQSEWWHFTLPVGGAGGEFDILPREHRFQ